MMARWCASICLVVLCGVVGPVESTVSDGLGQDRLLTSSGQIRFRMDWEAFRATEEKTYVEVDMLLSLNGFSFVREEDRYRADYQVRIQALASGETAPKIGSQVDQVWRRGMDLSSGEKDTGNTTVLDVFSFLLLPGAYQLTVEVIDTHSGAEGAYRGEIVVPAFGAKTLSISNLQLASHIGDANRPGRFVKNGKRVVPNITRRFLQDRSALHVYFEIYNLAIQDAPKTFDLAYTILDTTGFQVKSYSSKRFRKPGTSCVMGDSLDIQGLSPDRYVLQVLVKDNGTGKIVTGRRLFQIWRLEEVSLATDEASLERYYNQIQYIAEGEELDEYRGLDPEEKVRFILAFWKKRDPTPNTPENEFAAEYFKRIHYADTNFPALPRHKGSNTDRGRVYIKYGPPDHVERHDYHSTGKSYEIWSYDQIGYYKFVFVDKRGNSVHELVHSTMPGELYNPNWQAETMRIHDRAGMMDRVIRPGDVGETEEP